MKSTRDLKSDADYFQKKALLASTHCKWDIFEASSTLPGDPGDLYPKWIKESCGALDGTLGPHPTLSCQDDETIENGPILSANNHMPVNMPEDDCFGHTEMCQIEHSPDATPFDTHMLCNESEMNLAVVIHRSEMNLAEISGLEYTGLHDTNTGEQSYATERPEMNHPCIGTVEFEVSMSTPAMQSGCSNSNDCLDGYQHTLIMAGRNQAEEEVKFGRMQHLENTCSTQSERIKTLEIHLASANKKLKQSDLTTVETVTKYENQKRILEDIKLRLTDAEQKNVDGEKLRKKLHNTMIELTDKVRVICRVRPLVSNESGAVSCPKSGENTGRVVNLIHETKPYSYTFSKVLDDSSSQEDVFTEVSELVESALHGHKVCIFAYGQTGSGKTHTMIGKPEVHDQKGLIPRSLELIFERRQYLISQGWKYEIQASMSEIYNETIRDLLPNHHVASIDEVSSLLKDAAQRRSTGQTNMNEESSRCHFVFTLQILAVNQKTHEQSEGVLNLIDLAGIELVDKSGATGDRINESKVINGSLHSLSNVIHSLLEKDGHIQYGNCKLTDLLQPCFGGDARILMIINLSPEASCTSESFFSLYHAPGRVRRNVRKDKTVKSL